MLSILSFATLIHTGVGARATSYVQPKIITQLYTVIRVRVYGYIRNKCVL